MATPGLQSSSLAGGRSVRRTPPARAASAYLAPFRTIGGATWRSFRIKLC